MLFGAAPNGSGNGLAVVILPALMVALDDKLFTLLKSAKFEFAVEAKVSLLRPSFNPGLAANALSPTIFELLVTTGGQTKLAAVCTGLLPVVGHGLVFN